MLLTTKGRYAVMAVIEIASQSSAQPLSLLEISKRQSISLSYLEQIFARLKKAGIVDSIKGPGGGYLLKKPHAEIDIAQIIQAVGEPIKMTRCRDAKKGCVVSGSKCKTHRLWEGLEMKIHDHLKSISLEEVCK